MVLSLKTVLYRLNSAVARASAWSPTRMRLVTDKTEFLGRVRSGTESRIGAMDSMIHLVAPGAGWADVHSARVFGLLGVAAVALFLGMFLSAQAGLFFLAAAWTAVGAWRYPKAAFFLLIFFAPLLPALKATQVLSALTPLKDVVIAALFLRTTIVPVLTKTDPYRRNTLLGPILLFVLWAGLGFLRADQMVLGLLRLRDLLLYLPLLWVARSLLESVADLRTFLRVVLGSATLVVLLVGVQFLAFPDGMVLRFDPASSTWIPRASGTLAHPNLLGSLLLFVLPLALSLALVRSLARPLRGMVAGLALVGLVVLVLTYSRSAWIAAAVAVLGLLFLVAVKRRAFAIRWALGGLVIAAVLALAIPNVRTLLRTVVDPTYASNETRLQILAGLVADSTTTSALIGHGLGDVTASTLRTVSISLGDIASVDVRQVQVAKARTFVDNAILKTWIELGLVGLLLFAWMTWRVLRGSWEESMRGRTPEGRAFSRALFSTTVGLAILSFFLDVPEIFPVALLWWSFVGVLHALPYLGNEQ